MRYSRLCAMLQEQGMHVICCTIFMLDSVRDWNRNNILNYREIYLNVSMDTLRVRDQKGLYSQRESEGSTDVVRVHMNVEEPKQPDFRLFL